jgi:hypothetical protein
VKPDMGSAAKSSPRRRRRKRVMNTLAEPLTQAPGTEWGPAMKALPSDRHRSFVMNLYELPPGWGCNAKAARIAGFGTSTSSAASMATIGWRLAHDEKVLAAIAEQDKLRIRASAPRAISALQRVVEDPDHKDHIRAVGMVLDRTHAVTTHHTVDVHHHVDHDAEAVAQLRMLRALEVSKEKLIEVFGFSGLSRYERLLQLEDARNSPHTIEGQVVTSGDAAASQAASRP